MNARTVQSPAFRQLAFFRAVMPLSGTPVAPGRSEVPMRDGSRWPSSSSAGAAIAGSWFPAWRCWVMPRLPVDGGATSTAVALDSPVLSLETTGGGLRPGGFPPAQPVRLPRTGQAVRVDGGDRRLATRDRWEHRTIPLTAGAEPQD